MADTIAPRLVSASTVAATPRGIAVRVRLDEPAKVTVLVQRKSGKTLARRNFGRRPSGLSLLRIRAGFKRGPLRVRIAIADDAGNVTVRTLGVRIA